MKNIGLACWLLLSICCGLQAKKTVKIPYFMACNSSSIEIEKVTLGEDTTWLAVRIYGMPGEKVKVDFAAVLQASGKNYEYWGNSGFSKEEWTSIPASGEMAATLKFKPLPMDTDSFDFVEMPGSDSAVRRRCCCRAVPVLWISRSKIDLFLVPGGELDVTINLPEIFYSQSRLLSRKRDGATENRAWFEGDYAGLNAELLRYGEMKSLSSLDGFYADICGMTPQAYKKYVFRRYGDMQKKLSFTRTQAIVPDEKRED